MALREQPWFWGDVEKAVVSEYMAREKDGTFMVRNATSPGQFTLTLRCGGQTKLVRILVKGGKCGFTLKDLCHNSVMDLIAFHTKNSLKVYNRELDVCLKYPLSRPLVRSGSIRSVQSSASSHKSESQIKHDAADLSSHPSTSSVVYAGPQRDPEWEQRLSLERLRIAQVAMERATRLYETAHYDNQKAETLHHNYTRTMDELDRKISELSDILETQALVMKDENIEKRTLEAMQKNRKIIQSSVERISTERQYIHEERTKLMEIMKQLQEEQATCRTRFLSEQNDRNRAYKELTKQKVDVSLLDATSHMATDMLRTREDITVSYRLADLPLPWDPVRYLVNDSSKEYAGRLIQTARQRITDDDPSASTNGIFLIRPSGSQPDKLVLTVLSGDKVNHCLIEQTDMGWGFASCNMYFITIGDFVRYYASETLADHNAEISTTLNHPVFA